MTKPEEIARLLSEGTKSFHDCAPESKPEEIARLLSEDKVSSFFHGCAPESFDMNLKRGRMPKGTYVTSDLKDAIAYGVAYDHSWRSHEEWKKLVDQGSPPGLSHVIEIDTNGRFGLDADYFDCFVMANDPDHVIDVIMPAYSQIMSPKDAEKLFAIYKDFADDPARQGQNINELLSDWGKIVHQYPEHIPLINPAEAIFNRFVTLESMPIKGAYVFSPTDQNTGWGPLYECTKVAIQGTIKLGHQTRSGNTVLD